MNTPEIDNSMIQQAEAVANTPKARRVVTYDKSHDMAVRIQNGEAGEYIYCLEDQKFYHYKDGYWEALFDKDFIGRVQEAIPEMTLLSVQARKNIAENFSIINRRKLERFNWSELINLKNGMLSPWTQELDPHDPVYMSTNRLPYIFDASAKCELWLNTLDQIFEGDKLKVGALQEYFGYCLTRDTKQHKALLLLGESRSGKSTILGVLGQMVGENNCSHVPLKDVRNSQHTPDLINKLVNFDYDVSAKAVEFEDEFKKITSGEPIRVNQKYVCAFSFRPYCKLAMAANIFPKITDHSSAFYNRLILIPCDRVFSPEEQNRDLPKLLEEELPGILNWAMEGLKRLTSRGMFEELEFMKEAVEELENDNNPVNVFFNEYITVHTDTHTYIEKGELYEHYKRWTEKTKNFPLSSARFASCVFRRFHKSTSKNCQHPETRKRIWRCLKYNDNQNTTEGQQVSWQE